jgi:hypothetical protein
LQLARGDKLIEDEIGLCSPTHTHARTHARNKNPSTRLSGQMITCERTRAASERAGTRLSTLWKLKIRSSSHTCNHPPPGMSDACNAGKAQGRVQRTLPKYLSKISTKWWMVSRVTSSLSFQSTQATK